MSLNSPAIPTTEFVPRPRAMVAVWGVAMRRFDGKFETVEVIEPGDIDVLGVAPNWLPAGDGSGVLYSRVLAPSGQTFALLRAVPLS